MNLSPYGGLFDTSNEHLYRKRIEELEFELKIQDDANETLVRQLVEARACMHHPKVADLEAKLAVAVEALSVYASMYTDNYLAEGDGVPARKALATIQNKGENT